MTHLTRRTILQRCLAASLSLSSGPRWLYAADRGGSSSAPGGLHFLPTTQTEPDGFFRLANFGGRTWLVSPDQELFFSIGFNHIDPATLRYPENIHLWNEKYGGSMRRWLSEAVKRHLLQWGFNSVGNTVEMASNGPTNHRQSRRFVVEEYRALGLPYCHQLDFADFHHWDAQHRLPDFRAPEFADWCDHVAREYCATMADDPLLIGYFLMDCPGWVHTHPHSRWRGPLFDPQKLDTEAGRRELFELSELYYRTVHDAIRRYDPHHLILGDRYEGQGRMAKEVLVAAKPYVDVLSFQHFGTPERICQDLNRWHDEIGLPTLLADSGKHVRVRDGSPVRRHDAEVYAQIMHGARDMPHCIGFHLCGAYMQNRIRHTGLLDELESPDREAIAGITATNDETEAWVGSFANNLERRGN